MIADKATGVPADKLRLGIHRGQRQHVLDHLQVLRCRHPAPGARPACVHGEVRGHRFQGGSSLAAAKEYVAVPDHLLTDTDALTSYLETSLQYALSLRPKAIKRRAAKKNDWAASQVVLGLARFSTE